MPTIIRPGYAIEYDYVDPRDAAPDAGVPARSRLFLAGQINGTTGYEEAAGQGLIAGAQRRAPGRRRRRCSSSIAREAYIGVMIDDLVTRGVDEPYRMFTSRSEYRLSLRADNADQRLTPRGMRHRSRRPQAGGGTRERRQRRWGRAAGDWSGYRRRQVHSTAAGIAGGSGDGGRRSGWQLLAVPTVTLALLARLWPELATLAPGVARQLENDARYQGYLQRQEADVRAFRRDAALSLPDDLDYDRIAGLSTEVRGKLAGSRPATLAAAARIPGVTPAALTALLGHVRRREADAPRPG